MNKVLNSLNVFTAVSLLLVVSPAMAASKNNQQLTDDVAGLQQSLGKIEQDMQRLQRLLDNRAMLELFQRMDELADEVSNLRGMLEQQNHDLAGIKKRQRELYLDIDRRLRELEISSTRGPASSASAPSIPAPSVPAPTVPGANAPVMPGPSPVTAPAMQAPAAPGVAKPASIAAPNASTVPVSDERAAYQRAFDMLKEGRYSMANAAFREFLGRFPQSSYAGNAQYWLGESNYVTRQFDQAVKEFQSVLKNYADSNKVPDAMLKLGYTYYELRRFDEARSILTQLQKNYAQSTAARLAGKRLDRMKREGY